MTGFHPQTSVTAPLEEVSWGLIKKQKAAFVCGSSLGPACLKITINRKTLDRKTSGKYISKYYYFYCIKPMCVRVRASTAVGSFVCSIARRGHTVWRKQKSTFVFSGRLAASQDLEHNTCAQAPKTVCLLWGEKVQEWYLRFYFSTHF